MPWTGSAPNQVFTRSTGGQTGDTAWALEKADGTDIEAEVFDTHDTDLKDGINACLKKDGGNTATSDIPMGNNKFTGVGDATVRANFPSMGQVQDGKADWYGTAAGTDTYTLSDNGFSLSAYVNGMTVRALFTNANTGAATLNINSIGAAAIVDALGNAIAAGHIAAGSVHLLSYNSSNSSFHIISSNNLTVPNSRALTAGVGLTGGGDLSADRSFALDIDGLTAETGALDRSDSVAIDDDSAGSVKKLTLDLVSALIAPSAIVLHTETQGTAYTGSTNNAWTKMDLDSTPFFNDGDSLVNVASSVITLKAGTYIVFAEHVASNSGAIRFRFRDTSAGADRGVSLSLAYNGTDDGGPVSLVTSKFEISSNTTYQLEYYGQNVTGSGDLGKPTNISGYTELYGRVIIYRIGD